MEDKLFEAAYVGDIKYVKEISKQLNVIVTPKKNTILHINIAFGRSSTSFVDRVLEICPPLLNQVSDNGDTPLHLAAKAGLVHIAEVLIKHAKAHSKGLECGLSVVKQMLRMTNNDGNTALHEAAQHPDLANVVKLLMKEDPDFPYDSANNWGTPLYIAVSRGCLEIVAVMLETCTSATYNYKDPCGMTILHAAVRRNHLDITRKIIEKSGTKILDENGWSLTKEIDESGWTPLHYAAYYGHHLIVKLLVEFDASAAYIADKCRKMTPLHLAAGQGHEEITRTIIISHRACVEQVDERGWNYVHFHMCSLTTPFDLRSYSLLDAKDVRGNTPLFVLASISPQFYGSINNGIQKKYADRTMHNIRDLEGQFDQLKNEVLELSNVRVKPYKLGVVRLRQKTDFDGFWSTPAKNGDIYLVVNALIATVTFTAGLTLPGGYIQEGSNKGTPVLIGNLAFQAFVISNAIALVLSILAVCLHMCWQLHRLKKHLFMIRYAVVFTICAMVATNFAFVAGTYAMLRPYSELAFITVIVVLSSFPIQLYFSYRMNKAGYADC